MKKSLLSLLAALLLFTGATSAFFVKASSDVIFGDLGSTSSASKTWTYEGYDVRRYDIGYEGSNYPVQLEGTDVLREKGIFLFSNFKDMRLFILREDVNEIRGTKFTLPKARTCFGCATSVSTFYYPIVFFVEDRIVVTLDEKWYLYDIDTDMAELWFDPAEVGLDAYDYWTAFTYNDQLYVSSYPEQKVNGFGTYWVSKPNTVERHSEMPGDMYYSPDGVQPTYPKVRFDSPLTPYYFKGTSNFSSDVLVGQIDDGVYILTNDFVAFENTLTRIGYSSRTLRGYWPGFRTFTESAPLTFGERSVAWIGADRGLYVATITGILPDTGIQDVIPYFPFRTVSDSAVYFDSASPSGKFVYMNKDAYMNAWHDEDFSEVVVIPDAAVDADDHLEKATPVY